MVLLPNVRGSSGYGKAFEELNDRDWGGGDLKDAIAGAEFLKGLGYVDTDAIGITGTSYGAILSMCAVTFAPGVFQAAVPMSGYSDWPRLRHVLELRHMKLLEHEFGPYDGNEDVWYRSSPFYRVKDATTPTFVLHGEGREDWPETSQDFAVEMKRQYKTCDYKVYPNDGFYVSTLHQRPADAHGLRRLLRPLPAHLVPSPFGIVMPAPHTPTSKVPSPSGLDFVQSCSVAE